MTAGMDPDTRSVFVRHGALVDINSISPWALLVITGSVVMFANELGYWLGRFAQLLPHREKLPPISSIVSSTLGLVAFILAFTFGMAGSRYDTRKALVRDEANAIRTVWMRSDFLPEPGRTESIALIERYLSRRVAAVESRQVADVNDALTESVRIQHRLWEIAIECGRAGMQAPLLALYSESLNRLLDTHALRVIAGLEARIPTGIWIALYSLIVVGMIGVGYQTVIAEASGRSVAPLILAVAFSLVISLITSLDRPAGGFIPISQQPLKDVQGWMNQPVKAGHGPVEKPSQR